MAGAAWFDDRSFKSRALLGRQAKFYRASRCSRPSESANLAGRRKLATG